MTKHSQTEYHTIMPSPVGRLRLACSDHGLTQLVFWDDTMAVPASIKVTDHPILAQATAQLSEYFRGQRRDFSLPFDLRGSAFEMAAWRTLSKIAYGATVSYQQQATKMGTPTAARAVGRANGRNPLPIIIPCHRVITANGKIGGYIAGSTVKARLLELENQHAH